ncbi:MAG: helix-turn-helix domain-containing protein [Acidimicrobiia bacterium]
MKAATLLRFARERAGLSKRELARRARTSPAALVTYEQGSRDPTVGTLLRIVQATGADADLVVRRRGPDPVVAARRLEQVLDLADALPHRRAARELPFPRFG